MTKKKTKRQRSDPFQARARELALASGIDPDSRIERPGLRSMPAWCKFRQQAQEEEIARKLAEAKIPLRQPDQYKNSPLHIAGEHDPNTITQMYNCMRFGNVVSAAICADGHLGYAQPVGGVVAYEGQISISGVGFDIACGNQAVQLDLKRADINTADLLPKIAKNISFGIGRSNKERVEHSLFDDDESWRASGMWDYKDKAVSQLGTVGGGNHYVDLLEDEAGFVWIGVHFGSRGLGHTSATRYLRAAGGKDGIHAPPTVLDEHSELGQQYLAAMHLAGRYAYAGREFVIEHVRKLTGGSITDSVHNHHNFAWKETHNGRNLWVVRKGATPAFPGQRGFVGGSMGDDAVIIEGIESAKSQSLLYSTIHGAGRLFGRKEAKRRFGRVEMDEWLKSRGVFLIGGDIDESPMAYRRLPEVLACHNQSVRILHTLRPFGVVMAGSAEFDPFKD